MIAGFPGTVTDCKVVSQQQLRDPEVLLSYELHAPLGCWVLWLCCWGQLCLFPNAVLPGPGQRVFPLVGIAKVRQASFLR